MPIYRIFDYLYINIDIKNRIKIYPNTLTRLCLNAILYKKI